MKVWYEAPAMTCRTLKKYLETVSVHEKVHLLLVDEGQPTGEWTTVSEISLVVHRETSSMKSTLPSNVESQLE